MDEIDDFPSADNQTESSTGKSWPAEYPKTRKKVTFDPDIQVHTIPKRIPVYERQPASYTARNNYHPLAFTQRSPLQFHGKNRQFYGNATSKHIVGLFTNSLSASNPHSTATRSGYVGQNKPVPRYFNYAAKNLYSLSNLKQPGKMSRAAANLKQITAALGGENIEENVSKEYEDATRRIHSAGSCQRVVPTSYFHQGLTNDKDTSKPQIINRTTLSHSAPTLLYQQIPEWQTNVQSNHNSATAGHQKEQKDSPSKSNNNQVLLKLRTVSLHEPTQYNHGRINLHSKLVPKTPSSAGVQLDTRRLSRQTNTGSYRLSLSDVGQPRTSDGADRPSSRCSTIDTYVISDTTRKNINNSNSTKDKFPVTPNKRSVAWAAELHVKDPVLDVTVLRTPVRSSEVPYFPATWHSNARASTFSTIT